MPCMGGLYMHMYMYMNMHIIVVLIVGYGGHKLKRFLGMVLISLLS